MNQAINAPTAAVLLIGNELLSGRTQDINLSYIARRLQEKGIRVKQARIIPDNERTIVDSINELRAQHDYLFTTGGIGPTHDDITADCVAKAFGVELPINEEAERILNAYFREREIESNKERLRMARIPVGASLVDNPVSAAPGFRMDNVFVFAGVPRIMQAMLDSVLPELSEGTVMKNRTVTCNLGEGTIAAGLRTLQEQYPDVEIGSYPGKMDDQYLLSLVATSLSIERLDEVCSRIEQLIDQLGGKITVKPG
ncbi:MAG: competence/damage-inducible protein A [Granulosicoccus sp.]